MLQQEFYRFERGLKSQLNVFAKQVVTKIMEDKDDAVTPEKIPEFNVAFYNIPEQLKLRDLKTDRIGGLSRITGLYPGTRCLLLFNWHLARG